MYKVLFIGNSMLGSIFMLFNKNRFILGNDVECAFFLDKGGWGPSIALENDLIIPSNRSDKDKFPDVYFPENILQIPISSYDCVVIVGPGSIHGILKDTAYLASYGQIYEFDPKENDLTNTPVSISAFDEMLNFFIKNQQGVKLINSLNSLSALKIVIEQPLVSEAIKRSDEWVLSKLYKNPAAAISYFQNKRSSILKDICDENGFIFIESMFKDIGFTPEKYIFPDFLHFKEEYAALLCDQIKLIISEKLK